MAKGKDTQTRWLWFDGSDYYTFNEKPEMQPPTPNLDEADNVGYEEMFDGVKENVLTKVTISRSEV